MTDDEFEDAMARVALNASVLRSCGVTELDVRWKTEAQLDAELHQFLQWIASMMTPEARKLLHEQQTTREAE